jgi:hypothetical protein
MKTIKPNPRRNFLLAAGAATAGAAAVATTGRKPDAKTSDAAAPGAQPSGYHVTEHMLKYYKTAKV